jgi:hypothetical protein
MPPPSQRRTRLLARQLTPFGLGLTGAAPNGGRPRRHSIDCMAVAATFAAATAAGGPVGRGGSPVPAAGGAPAGPEAPAPAPAPAPGAGAPQWKAGGAGEAAQAQARRRARRVRWEPAVVQPWRSDRVQQGAEEEPQQQEGGGAEAAAPGAPRLAAARLSVSQTVPRPPPSPARDRREVGTPPPLP